MIRLSSTMQNEIEQHGSRDFPNECCGVLLGEIKGQDKIVTEVRPLLNAFSPSDEFERSVLKAGETEAPLGQVGQERRYMLSPDTMFKLMQEERRTGVKILGFYHSHPNHPALPSEYDRTWAMNWYTYIIVSIIDGSPAEMTAWSLDRDQRFQTVEIAR